MIPLLEKLNKNLPKKYENVTADAGYESEEGQVEGAFGALKEDYGYRRCFLISDKERVCLFLYALKHYFETAPFLFCFYFESASYISKYPFTKDS